MTNEERLTILEGLAEQTDWPTLFWALAIVKAAVEAEEAVDNLNAGTSLLPHHMLSLEALQDALNDSEVTE